MYSRAWSSPYRGTSVGRTGFVEALGLWSEEQAAIAGQIEAGLDEIDLVRLVFCDPHGLARSKTLTTDSFRSALRNGMDFSPGPFIFDTGHAVAVDFLTDPGVGIDELLGAGDFVVVPDPITFQIMDTSGPRTAWVLGDEYLRDGTPHPLSTRGVLRRVCDRYAANDLSPIIGLEVEWYLTKRLDGPPGNVGNGFGLQGNAPSVQAVNAGYQFNLDSYYDSVATVTDPLAMRLLELGLPLRSMEHESGPGQVETTFNPMQALDAADALLLFRTTVKQGCNRIGYHASFMSLPQIDGFDPSGWHVHQSVMQASTGQNVFCIEGKPDGLSESGKAYVDGILQRARDLCLLSVPTVNGYRRLTPEFSLAPTRIGWSFEDRSVLVRVLDGGDATHIENRIGEPCANPYLAMAAQLSAGLDGMLRTDELAADPDVLTTLGETLPQSLREALRAFDNSHSVALLGAPLAACLTKVKESEASRFEAWLELARPPEGIVTDWEQREYFENF